MAHALSLAFSEVTDPFYMAMVAVGVVVGSIIGILPGVGAMVSMAIVLGFIYPLNPAAGLGLILGAASICVTADTITCVLFGVPGTVGSMATILDGYPLAKKGEAARALGAAFSASMIGGLIGAFCLTLSLPIARPMIKHLIAPHFFMLSLLGIIMTATLGGKAPIKGIGAACVGMMMSAIGVAQFTAVFRYTWDIPYLYDGLPLVVVALGIFAVPELMEMMVRGTQISNVPELGKGLFSGVRDTFQRLGLVIKCSIIGAIVGFIPGLGQSAANWFAYSYALNQAKDKESFGKGDIRGVIAPESANNACVGGAIIPTILFGIPGSGAMALLLGAFLMLGIYPGRSMLTTNLHITLTMVWTLGLANVLAAVLCMVATRPLARITTLRIHYIIPFVLTIVLMGAYQSTRHWGDLLILLMLGIFGWFMKKYGWPRPALFVGFILGGIGERYLYITVEAFGAKWFRDPGVIGIAALMVFVLYYAFKKGKPEAEKSTAREQRPMKLSGAAFFALLLGVFFLSFGIIGTGYIHNAWIYPVFTAIIGLILALMQLVRDIRSGGTGESAGFDLAPERSLSDKLIYRRAGKFVGWVIVLYALTWLVGFKLAIILYFLLFLKLEGSTRWAIAALLTTIIFVTLLLFESWLGIYWPSNLLDSLVKLPYLN